MPAVRLPVSFFSRQIAPLGACKWQTVLIYAYYKWFVCKSSRRFSVRINNRTDKIWYNKINLLEKEILYVFRFWDQSGKEGAGIREDRYLRSVRRLWEISGFYDLLLFQPLFYSHHKMEPALLGSDVMLQYRL